MSLLTWEFPKFAAVTTETAKCEIFRNASNSLKLVTIVVFICIYIDVSFDFEIPQISKLTIMETLHMLNIEICKVCMKPAGSLTYMYQSCADVLSNV